MPIIDADGMFNGDRMALLSDDAKVYWPWFFLASNGFARMELNYRRFVSKVFPNFTSPITEQQFWSLLEEYRDAYLLFIYRAGAQLWGQWDTSEKFLPRHKRKEDLSSPIPPSDEFSAWKATYAANRVELLDKPLVSTIAESLRGISETPRGNVRVGVEVVGVVVGVVGGEGTESATRVEAVPQTSPANSNQTEPSRGESARRERNSSEPPNTELDAFGQYWELFVAAGKPLNEKDKISVCQTWFSHDAGWQQAALADARARIANGTWPDVKRTSHPKNHLYEEPWTRVAQPRTLPTVERDSKSSRLLELAAQRDRARGEKS